MREFIAKHQKSGLKMIFKYGQAGYLISLTFDGEWLAEGIEKVKTIFPASVEKMIYEMQNQRTDSKWVFAEITDISFDAFYKRYPKKVGRRELTEKAYNKLSDTDKLEAILYIDNLIKLKYDGTAFPYPVTYLNQKHWR